MKRNRPENLGCLGRFTLPGVHKRVTLTTPCGVAGYARGVGQVGETVDRIT